MRILDENSNKSLEKMILFLTQSEAAELRDGLNDLLRNSINNHIHLSNDNFQKEVTVCVYDINNLDNFDERSKDLILNDS